MLAAGDKRYAAFTHEESSYLAKRVTQAAIENHQHVVVDGTGVKVPSQRRPILREHDRSRIVGHTDSVNVNQMLIGPLFMNVSVILLFVLPLVGLVVRAPWSAAWDLVREPGVRTSLRLSLVCSLLATAGEDKA